MLMWPDVGMVVEDVMAASNMEVPVADPIDREVSDPGERQQERSRDPPPPTDGWHASPKAVARSYRVCQRVTSPVGPELAPAVSVTNNPSWQPAINREREANLAT